MNLATRHPGSAALDLVNTISWRDDPARRHDRLYDFDALADWVSGVAGLGDASARCLRAASEAPERGSALQGTVRLREAVHTVLTSDADDHRSIASVAVTRQAARALSSANVDPHLPLSPAIELRAAGDIVHWLALDAFALVTSPDAGRVKTCEGHGCGWLFLDRSRNQSRRWCDSADCGNRARVRRHYQRHRSERGTDRA